MTIFTLLGIMFLLAGLYFDRVADKGNAALIAYVCSVFAFMFSIASY